MSPSEVAYSTKTLPGKAQKRRLKGVASGISPIVIEIAENYYYRRYSAGEARIEDKRLVLPDFGELMQPRKKTPFKKRAKDIFQPGSQDRLEAILAVHCPAWV